MLGRGDYNANLQKVRGPCVLCLTSVCIFSPFALLEDGAKAAVEESTKDFKEMILTHQVLHPDCRPVLEFRMVRVNETGSTSLIMKGVHPSRDIIVGRSPRRKKKKFQ